MRLGRNSGGTSILGIPCLTVRENTERPITLTAGTNLVGSEPEKILAGFRAALQTRDNPDSSPPLWDDHAAQRIVAILRQMQSGS